nr:hypothetical protein [Tanacetum cinerariifolium]
MAPKRTSTSASPAMTQAAIRQLIADGIAAALEAQATNMASTNNLNRNTKPRETHVARKCTYKEFIANCIESLTKDLELLKKEKGELETKLTGFQTASKDLDSLLESQILDKNNEGLGYSAVPPSPAQIYSPPKKDMSWTGLSEFKDNTVTDNSRPSPAIESTSDDAQNRNPSEAS